MEIPTKTITTERDFEVELKEWVPGRVSRKLTNIFLSDAEITQRGKEQEIRGIKASKNDEAEDLAIKEIVVSITPPGGEKITENIREAILEMPASDYREVIDEINTITGSKKKKKN